MDKPNISCCAIENLQYLREAPFYRWIFLQK